LILGPSGAQPEDRHLSGKKQKRSRQEQQHRQQQRKGEKRKAFAIPLPAHPFAFYRTDRLAQLFDVRRETVWRWRRDGVLPPFTKIGGVEGLTGEQVQRLLEQRQRGAGDAR
jgi:hypothetical protein